MNSHLLQTAAGRRGSRNGFFVRHPSSLASEEGVHIAAERLESFGEQVNVSADRYGSTSSPRTDLRFAEIVVLLDRRSPAAILRRVPEGVIDAVERVRSGTGTGGCRLWAGAHVGQEQTVRSLPPSADGNATPAVVGPTGAVGVRTAVLHLRPCLVFGGQFPIQTSAVFDATCPEHRPEFSTKTTAGFGTQRGKSCRGHAFTRSAARALAPIPFTFQPESSVTFNDCPPTDLLAHEIHCSHEADYNTSTVGAKEDK